jgi:hypothetical protein
MERFKMEFHIICRNEPTEDEISRSIFDRTDDQHRENKNSESRYAVNMLATVCGCGDISIYPLDPAMLDMVATLDEIAAGRRAERFEFQGHVWHRIGPLSIDDMHALGSAALGFFMNFLSPMDGTDLAQDPAFNKAAEREGGQLH